MEYKKRAARLGLFALFISACSFGPSQAAMIDGAEVPLHHVESSNCKECHKKIYKQWSGSMHAKSSALKDPIHGAFYRNVVGDPAAEGVKVKGQLPVCLQCHAPNAAVDGKTKLDSLPAYNEGVNCVACHSFASYKGIQGEEGKMQLGVKAYELSDKIQAPNGFLSEQGAAADRLRAAIEDSGDLNPHLGVANDGRPYMSEQDMASISLPMEKNTLLQGSDACMGCHDRRNNGHGVPLCATGDEFVASNSKETCQSCHMPITDGVVDHSMGGGHDDAMLKRAVSVDLATERSGEKVAVKVTIVNRQPHSVPTGAPFRNMVLKVTALSKEGEVVWQNYKQHPSKEDPQAYFNYMLTDDEGKFASPPKATRPGENSRLKAYETRELSYGITAVGVDSVRAELFYNLLWPGLVKKMEKLPAELKAPKRIGWAESKIN